MTAVMAPCRFQTETGYMMTPFPLSEHDFSGDAPPPADLLSLVDALAPGQTLTLRLARETARAFLSMLLSERKGLFEWSPDADGMAVTVEVARRDAVQGSSRSILEALSWDHDRIDAIERAAFAARAAGDLGTATLVFGRFARGLLRHIEFEEELLFPALETKAGFPPHAGPTAVMRAEHIEIRALIERLLSSIGDPSVDPNPLRQRLQETLTPHNDKEEQILYPMSDQFLSAAGADGLVARIQAYEARV